MPETTTEHAPAKINLALHITGRRPDGYHLLETLVVFTEAGDTISVRDAAGDELAISGAQAAALAGEGDNLVTRARDLMRELAPEASRPVGINLEKALPVASGIGGGSSDAAATLRALRRHWGLSIDDDALARWALRLGADVPMCLAARPLVARGIGDRLTPVDALPRLHLVLVNPGVAVATPAVFKALRTRDNPPLPPLKAFAGLGDFVSWLGQTRNDLETPAIETAPAIQAALDALRSGDALLARMSGSGATCFGIFPSADTAERAAEHIARHEPSWYVKATPTVERMSHNAWH